MNSHDANIYLIDNDPVSTRAIEGILRLQGYSVRTYASSREFMDDLSIGNVGCVIASVGCSVNQCIEIQKELLWRGSDLAVISISNNNNIAALNPGSRRVVIAMLEFPFTDEQLINIVERFIAKSYEKKAKWDLLEEVQRRMSQLTENERSVLKSLMKGLSRKNISSQLQMSLRSVDRRRQSILEKLHASNLQELVALLAELHRQLSQRCGLKNFSLSQFDFRLTVIEIN